MKKIILILFFIFLISLGFVSGELYKYIEPTCEGCERDNKCYNIGTRLTIQDSKGEISIREGNSLTINGYTFSVVVFSNTQAQFTIASSDGTGKTPKMNKGDMEKISGGKYIKITEIKWNNENEKSSVKFSINGESYKLNFPWRTDKYIYCGGGKVFISQKVTGESCENDFECQSNKCYNRKCEQKQGIKIIKLYEDEEYIIQNILFKQNETFYFDEVNKNYFIGLGKANDDFLIFINDETYDIQNNEFILNENTYFILNNILFENSVAYANITFIESKNSIEDSQKLIDELLWDEEESEIENSVVENNSRETSEEEISTPMTGATIGTQDENIFDKIINFLKNLFSKN